MQHHRRTCTTLLAILGLSALSAQAMNPPAGKPAKPTESLQELCFVRLVKTAATLTQQNTPESNATLTTLATDLRDALSDEQPRSFNWKAFKERLWHHLCPPPSLVLTQVARCCNFVGALPDHSLVYHNLEDYWATLQACDIASAQQHGPRLPYSNWEYYHAWPAPPDGKHIVTQGVRTFVLWRHTDSIQPQWQSLYNLRDVPEKLTCPFEKCRCRSVAFSPDGSLLALGSWPDHTIIIPLHEETAPYEVPLPQSALNRFITIVGVCFAQDNSLLIRAFAGAPSLWVRPRNPGLIISRKTTAGAWQHTDLPLPAFEGYGGTEWVCNPSRQGPEMQVITGHPTLPFIAGKLREYHSTAWEAIVVVDLSTPETAKTPVLLPQSGLCGVAWSPDGNFIVAGTALHNKPLVIWDWRSQQRLYLVDQQFHPKMVQDFISWAPNNTILFTHTQIGGVQKDAEIRKIPLGLRAQLLAAHRGYQKFMHALPTESAEKDQKSSNSDC